MVDIRQIVANNVYLPQIAEAMDKKGDSLALATDSELTMPLRIRASDPSSLVVNVENIKITNPQHSRSRTIPPINGVIPAFISGTITIPSATGGNITNSTGAPAVVLTLSTGYYAKIGINFNSSAQLIVSVGVPSTVSANAGIPPVPQGSRGVGYFTAYNLGGTIQVISNASIVQYIDMSANATEGAVFVKWGSTIVSGPYSVSLDDYLIPIDTTAMIAPLTINLPAVTTLQKGRQLIVKDVGGNISRINKYANIVPNGSDKIENISGLAGATRMDMDNMSLTFVCDGLAGWWII